MSGRRDVRDLPTLWPRYEQGANLIDKMIPKILLLSNSFIEVQEYSSTKDFRSLSHTESSEPISIAFHIKLGRDKKSINTQAIIQGSKAIEMQNQI